ncbi:hypothetical protein [Longimicrobium terrae]|uniref:Uncharacterized protein n=1 Tax=Longimicrobium terrae TaxID=1639882 RepID=A0A841GUB9_9BACT|nr:hypothetical protein [Longimicrobium terrae]MBB4634577.1 hypothetical protein [Longimicrobium terrae]MBB6068533.1 hypothetical protein [Longimicrobium terrae]NNC27722.1 hypothetical protein [Longimicrobium terrae]
MTIRSLARTLLTAAGLMLAASCAWSEHGMYGPSLPSIGPRTELAQASWTPRSGAGEIAAWMREGCKRPAGGKQACVERALTGLIDPAGIAKSMEVLDTLTAQDGEVRLNAHALAHGLGISAYRSPETLAATFAGCTPSQMSGCYHGVVQGYFLALKSAGKPVGKTELDGVCAPHRASPFLFFQCAHGMGHGLMAVHANHVPMALEACDQASENFIRESCYGGVFMENLVNVSHPHHTAEGHAGTQHGAAAADEHAGHDMPADEHAGHTMPAAGYSPNDTVTDEHAGHDMPAAEHAGHDMGADAHAGHGMAARGAWKALDRSDPHYPCNAVNARYGNACYSMQTSVMLYFNNGDITQTASNCAQAPEAFRPACFASLGRDITALTEQNHARSLELCGRAEGRGQLWCVQGVAQNLVNVSADPDEGLRFCRIVTDGAIKSDCYRIVGESIQALEGTPERRAARCETAEPGMAAACRRGAGLPAAER